MKNARVAQGWSTTLPRLGSRVRVPSRALKNKKKGYPETDILFLIVRALPGGNIEVYAPLRSLQSERPLDVLQCLALFLWFGLTYGIGMCYAERSICKNGNRRVICLFLCIKICRKSLSFSYGECQKDFMEKRRGKKRWERKRQGKLT